MAVTVGNPANNRSLEKLFEDAEVSGKLLLRNKRLKEIGQFTCQQVLCDVSYVDLTSNRLQELPTDAYDWRCCETLLLSYNVIKTLPDFIADFKLLQILNLSNNQLSIFSACICEMRSLRVLILANNKIISIPEEISNLRLCEHFDVSCNSLTAVPTQIADMKNLKCLNLRRNSIQTLPENMSEMRLTHFYADCNRISTLPINFRKLPCIEEFNMENNPLTTPELSVLRKGHIHAFKRLNITASDLQIKKDVMEDPIMSPLKLKGSASSDFHMFDLGSRPWTSPSVTEQDAEERITQAANQSKDRRLKSNPSSPKKQVSVEVMRSSSVSVKSSTSKPKVLKEPTKTSVQKSSSPRSQENKDSVSNVKRVSSALHRGGTPNGIIRKTSSDSLSKGSSKSTKTSAMGTKRTTKVSKLSTSSTKKVNGTATPANPETKQTQDQLRSFVKQRKALSPTSDNNIKRTDTSGQNILKPRGITRRRTPPENDASSFTVRRKNEKVYEELALIEELRLAIESRLKVNIGDNVQAALSNGITLCHLLNHVRPQSITTIHIPSPAVPVLSRAKSLRNADNFVDTCKRIGIQSSLLCSSQDILDHKNIMKICLTVKELLKRYPGSSSPKKTVTGPVVKIAPSIITKSQSAV